MSKTFADMTQAEQLLDLDRRLREIERGRSQWQLEDRQRRDARVDRPQRLAETIQAQERAAAAYQGLVEARDRDGSDLTTHQLLLQLAYENARRRYDDLFSR